MSATLINFLNDQQVAEFLGVSVATIRRWRLLGRGPKYLKIGAAVRYKLDDLTTWIESRPSGGDRSETK